MSRKRSELMREVAPIRTTLIDEVGKCEICGASPDRPRRQPELSQLCCHEISNGPNRWKSLGKRYCLLVLCWHCNQEVCNKKLWPEARQLSILKWRRPEDYSLVCYNAVVNERAPNRITEEDVDAYLKNH